MGFLLLFDSEIQLFCDVIFDVNLIRGVPSCPPYYLFPCAPHPHYHHHPYLGCIPIPLFNLFLGLPILNSKSSL